MCNDLYYFGDNNIGMHKKIAICRVKKEKIFLKHKVKSIDIFFILNKFNSQTYLCSRELHP